MNAVAFNKNTISAELDNIAQWWLDRTLDQEQGGFAGEVDFFGNVVANTNKSIVQNSRILWFYSEQAMLSHEPKYLEAATRAFEYLLTHFDDIEFGGCLWEVSATGELVDGKKQTYALSFCIYAFVAYYRLTGSNTALKKAKYYFNLIETHARDRERGGYIEAYSREWKTIKDLRLSDKDLNTPKSMNTHLHLLEAYTALFSIQPQDDIKEALTHVLDIFTRNIVNTKNNHLKLFFDIEWNDLSHTISYGHDIEASWLIWEAVEVLGDKTKMADCKKIILALADTCFNESVGKHNQICDEYEISKEIRHEESHWWVQAEALVGFLNAHHLTKDNKYLDICEKIWTFIQRHHIDNEGGEWHWISNIDAAHKSKYKAGPWKAPYHNGRAMMEVCKLLDAIG